MIISAKQLLTIHSNHSLQLFKGMRKSIHEMLHIHKLYRQNRTYGFLNGGELSTIILLMVLISSSRISAMSLIDYHTINPKLSTLLHVYHSSRSFYFYLNSEASFDQQWQHPSLQARWEQTSRCTMSTHLAIPTTVFAAGTFTILTCAAMHFRMLQYNAALEPRHPEEVAFVEAQHRGISSRLRGSMRGVVFANWGRWRSKGSRKERRAELMVEEDI